MHFSNSSAALAALCTLAVTAFGCSDSPASSATTAPPTPSSEVSADPTPSPHPDILADVTAAAGPSANACQVSANEALDACQAYSGDVRTVRRACKGGTCEPEVENAVFAFASLETAHAGLLFSCTPASPELCDGIDNDKDFAIDEDFPEKGTVCSDGIGGCERGGFFFCSEDGSTTECSATPGPPGALELCNGIDDDCDGETDEDFVGAGLGTFCTAGTGVCLTSGTIVCDASDPTNMVCSATPNYGHPDYEADELSCDGLDNDCDTSIDEATGPLCPLQLGVCAGSTQVCGGQVGWYECSLGRGSYGIDYEIEESICDGLDNDCDGLTDENCT